MIIGSFFAAKSAPVQDAAVYTGSGHNDDDQEHNDDDNVERGWHVCLDFVAGGHLVDVGAIVADLA